MGVRLGRGLLTGLTAMALLHADAAVVALPTVQARPRLATAAAPVSLERAPGARVLLDLGIRVVADGGPWEVWLTRSTYRQPVVAQQILRTAGRHRRVVLPAGSITDLAGLPAFTHIRVVDPSGATVVEQDHHFCPNRAATRVHADAPPTSPYPRDCATNPFTLGAVWGIQAGWSALSSQPHLIRPLHLPDGRYTATVTINQPYRDLFGIPADAATASTAFTVTTNPALSTRQQPSPHTRHPAHLPARPTGPSGVPADPKPDLRPLPAWGIHLVTDATGESLRFNATVWNAGTSPLVVDGYRRPGTDLMDAFQSFYTTAGDQVGQAPTGTFEWDPRPGHLHWHFSDFARYRLIAAGGQEAVRSQKEAFCLANTDAVDYTMPGAVWRPDNTDLQHACGEHTATALRQRQDIGSGDTYVQDLPGQAFTITGLPNGTYHVEITANPNHHLHEQTTTNNVSRRTVVITGTPGARTVHVPPHEGIDAP